MSYLSLHLSEQEQIQQVQGYNTIKFGKSYRSVSAILLWISVAITVVTIVVGFSPESAFVDAGIMLVLSFFVMKGKKWALIVTMILWTVEKLYQLGDGSASNLITPIIWWALYELQFYKTYLVEKEHDKLSPKHGIGGPHHAETPYEIPKKEVKLQ